MSDSKTASGRDSGSGIRDSKNAETATGRDSGSGIRDAGSGQGSGIRDQGLDALIDAARKVREHACADFSHFKVGAALEASDGTIITGCNIENATYGLTVCAERVALWKALSDGHRTFRRIAIVTPPDAPTPPCGACRQLLWEFAGDVEVILANLQGETGRHRMSELLPQPFDARFLK